MYNTNKIWNRKEHPPRLFIGFLAVLLGFPPSVFALRQAGLEENAARSEYLNLIGVQPDDFRAGLEEGPVNVRKLRKWIGSNLLEFIREPELSVQFENVRKAGASRTPAKHLVKGAGQDWWVHMHLATPARNGDLGYPEEALSLKNGLLFRIVTNREGKVVGLADPLAEGYSVVGLLLGDLPQFFVALGQIPGESWSPLLSQRDLGTLVNKAFESVLKAQGELELEMRRNRTRYVLVRSVNENSTPYFLRLLGIRRPVPPFWLMENQRRGTMLPWSKNPYFVWSLSERIGGFTGRVPQWSYRGVFQRLDLPVGPEDEENKRKLLQSVQGTGLEETDRYGVGVEEWTRQRIDRDEHLGVRS